MTTAAHTYQQESDQMHDQLSPAGNPSPHAPAAEHYTAMAREAGIDPDREQTIALLLTIRTKIVDAIQLAKRVDDKLPYDMAPARIRVEERLSALLLARELAKRVKL